MRRIRGLLVSFQGLVTLLVAVISINVIASRKFLRLDVTQDQVFSLSQSTMQLLGKLDDEVTARLYFSRSNKELPPAVKTYATRVEEVLREYANHSRGRIKVEVIDPKPDTDEEEWARRYGMNGAWTQKGQQMFFGIVFLAGAREAPIAYLDPRREEFLEYDLTEALVRLVRKDKPKVGILSSLPVMGSKVNPTAETSEPWIFVKDLKKSFEVIKVPYDAASIPEDLRVLMIFHPKVMAEKTLYAIDQFVVHGGRLIVVVDPLSRADLTQGGTQLETKDNMPQISSDLATLFPVWGIEYVSDEMVGDLGLATQIQADGMGISYPYFISANESVMSRSSVVTNRLKYVLLAEAGAFKLKPDHANRLEALIESTEDSGMVRTTMTNFKTLQELPGELKVDGKKRIFAGLLQGRFKSAFTAAPREEGKPKKDAKPPKPFKAEADADNTILIIADTDFLSDSNAAEKFRIGNQTVIKARNDNLNFMFNATDFLVGSEELISIRSRGRIARPFTRVRDLQLQAAIKWQAEDEKLTREIEALQKKLNDLQAHRTDDGRFSFTPEQQEEIRAFTDQEREVRQRRREVRKNLREDIETLGRRLVVGNMLGVPFAVSVFGFGVFFNRNRRMRKEREHV